MSDCLRNRNDLLQGRLQSDFFAGHCSEVCSGGPMLPCGGLNSLLTPGELGVNSRCGDIDLFVMCGFSLLQLYTCHVATLQAPVLWQ